MTARPLDGRTVVVTRAAQQAPRFIELLREAGARVIEAPSIVIAPPASWAPLDAALAALSRFTWVVFTSVNGVSMVDRRLRDLGFAWSALAGLRVAAIGPATAAALEGHGLRVAVVPDEYRAEGLVGRLRGVVGEGDRILLPRAAQTRDVLVTELQRFGADVTEVPAYETRAASTGADTLRAALATSGVDVLTFTSSSTARNFARLFSDEERRAWFAGVTVASIGPVTAATAAEYGLVTSVMPSEYTIPALARAIADHFAMHGTVARAAGRRGAEPPPSEASR
jgi:uroporphyrinogen III methyltransferase/synthase